MKAWVVTAWRLDGRRSGIRVIGIVSARHATRHIERYVRELWVLLFMGLKEQMEIATYNRPAVPPKVKVDAGVDVHLFHSTTAAVRAQLSEIIGVRVKDGRQWLKWKSPKYERWSQNPKTFALQLDGVEQSKILEAEQVDLPASFHW